MSLAHKTFRTLCAGLFCAAGLFAPIGLYAHSAGKYLPDTPGPVTVFIPDRLADAPFFPDGRKTPLYKAYDEFRGKLSAKHIELTVYSVAIFPDGFLLNSSSSPAIVRYALKYKVFGNEITFAEAGSPEKPVFALDIPEHGTFLVSFPADGWLLFTAKKDVSAAKSVETPAAGVEKKAEPAAVPAVPAPASAKPLLTAIPEDIVLAYLWPSPGAVPEFPLMGEVGSISFYIRRLTKEKRPVLSEIVMPMKTLSSAMEVQSACQKSFDKVYQDASLLGPIPETLVNAFTVTRKEKTVTIHISLPDDLAKFFFSTFSQALQDAVKPFAVPEKLQ